MRVLVLDDEEITLDSMSLDLTNAGFTVETATCAKDAVAKSKTFTYDAIVADIRLNNGINGDGFAKYYKEKISPMTEIFLMSGADLENDLDFNVRKFYKKPFNTDDLIRDLKGLQDPPTKKITELSIRLAKLEEWKYAINTRLERMEDAIVDIRETVKTTCENMDKFIQKHSGDGMKIVMWLVGTMLAIQTAAIAIIIAMVK